MTPFKSDRSYLFSLWILFFCGVLSCGPEGYLVDIDVNGLPDDNEVVRLTVNASFAGQKAVSEISQSLDRFALRIVSASRTGPLELTVSALGVDDCQRYSATTQVMLPTSDPIVVQLKPDRGCKIVIANLSDGSGQVTALDGALSCAFADERPADPSCTPDTPGTCAFCLPLGMQLSFTPKAGDGSFFGGWTGECNRNDCRIRVPGGVFQVSANFVKTRRCSADDICWEHPASGLVTPSALFSRSVDDAWLVGAGGVVQHWNGASWLPQQSGTTRRLRGVWAGSTQDIWIVGSDGLALHSNGQGFAQTETGFSGTLHKVAGGPSGVFASGDDGTVLRWAGAGWQTLPKVGTGSFVNVSESADGDVWFITGDREVFRWDGQQLVPGPHLNETSGGVAIHAMGHGDAVAIIGSTAYYFHQNTVTSEIACPSGGYSNQIWGSSLNDIWVVCIEPNKLQHWDGSSWQDKTFLSDTYLYTLSGSSAHDVWGVDDFGRFSHFNGTFWTPDSQSASSRRLLGASLRPDGYALAVGDGTVLENRGARWEQILSGMRMKGVWSSDDGQLSWMVAETGEIFSLTHSVHSIYGIRLFAMFTAVFGLSNNDIYAVGESGVIFHNDGSTWSTLPFGGPNYLRINAVHGGMKNMTVKDIWFVGQANGTANGQISRYDGTVHQSAAVFGVGPLPPLNAVWWNSPEDIWIGGSSGAVIHFDGTQASPTGTLIPLASEDPQNEELTGLWGTGPNDMWIISRGGRIWHYTGGAGPARRMESGLSALSSNVALHGISGFKNGAQDEVLFVGSEGAILRYHPKAPRVR